MATIKDIAREANVSPTTVSNVIHGNLDRVTKETYDRIQKIIIDKNYVPNMSARALVNNSSKIIGVINNLVPKESGSFIQDPFHSTFIGGIELSLRKSGYYLLVRSVESIEELMSLLKNWNIDGLIFLGQFHDSFFDHLMQTQVPIVFIDSYIKHERVLNVGLEDFRGGYLATKYLIDNGHRNIIFTSPRMKEGGVIEERFKGYQKALEEADIPYNPENFYEHAMSLFEGNRLGHIIAERKDITAVFATADILAASIISGLKDKGLDVPGDISVVGFDDLGISKLITPKLTTIHQDAEQKGALAADLMIQYLERKKIDRPNIIMPVELVIRNSVRKIN